MPAAFTAPPSCLTKPNAPALLSFHTNAEPLTEPVRCCVSAPGSKSTRLHVHLAVALIPLLSSVAWQTTDLFALEEACAIHLNAPCLQSCRKNTSLPPASGKLPV